MDKDIAIKAQEEAGKICPHGKGRKMNCCQCALDLIEKHNNETKEPKS